MTTGAAMWYHNPGVIYVSARVDKLLKEIECLSEDEVKELIARTIDKFELLGWLKVAESAFSDWDNEEDAAYDNL